MGCWSDPGATCTFLCRFTGLHRDGEDRVSRKVAKLLTIVSFHSATGKAVRDHIRTHIVAGNAVSLHFFHFTLLHWEFVLCELRKVCCGQPRAYYRRPDAIAKHVDQFKVWRLVWENSPAAQLTTARFRRQVAMLMSAARDADTGLHAEDG